MKAFFTILLILALVGFITPSEFSKLALCFTIPRDLGCKLQGKSLACSLINDNCNCWCK